MLEKTVDAVLTDAPYNTPRFGSRPTLERDVSTEKDVNDSTDVCSDVIKLESHDHIFCFELYFFASLRALDEGIKSDQG